MLEPQVREKLFIKLFKRLISPQCNIFFIVHFLVGFSREISEISEAVTPKGGLDPLDGASSG
jgi:hypothetical protein